MIQLAEQGTLHYGVIFEGKLYKAFSVHLLTVEGRYLAQQDLIQRELVDDDGNIKESLWVELAYLAQQLTIEGIPAQALTPEFLHTNLTAEDYDVVIEALIDLRKKRLAVLDEMKPAQPANKAA